MQGTLGKEDTMIINPKKETIFHYRKIIKGTITQRFTPLNPWLDRENETKEEQRLHELTAF